ncbi:histone family protein DNA-binding protein [Spirochaeta thermophila DSM 6578]|uniref:Histone family protein DNA-binding protein n=1 Tax=Winmispira thermophila (strain ATCC 700085 / DSM 6578 / Z-1203) TaxID=869211 RepID=G0GA35_WINT7|nr:HU family DNA-binding protein [Spirochaeta thermophila]AEJ61723.1 histone family protein DNA-binding protein [Spirochaeta thermophila DSM 6578]
MNTFDRLPYEIQRQIEMLLQEQDPAVRDELKERYALAWEKKFQLFTSQTQSLGMQMLGRVEADDPRGLIILTYSGSLISLGPVREDRRWLEYASIKFRSDVPESIRAEDVRLAAPVEEGKTASFEGSALKQSSAVYKIAVCDPSLAPAEQERRVREATIYLTNGFVKINRSTMPATPTEIDHFTLRTITSYLSRRHGLPQKAVKELLADYLTLVEAGVLMGERVRLGNLGSFSLTVRPPRKARVMRHPATGGEILVPAQPAIAVPRFKPSRSFKEKAASVDISPLSPAEEP